jgi:hypothetical protein
MKIHKAKMISPDVIQKYVETFENTFLFTPEGELKTEHEDYIRAQEWWNTYRMFVSLLISVDTKDINFDNPSILSNENEKLMLHVYSLSYTAYVKTCQFLRRQMPQAHIEGGKRYKF